MIFGDFGAICCTYENPPYSKPWAIAQAYIVKIGQLMTLRNLPEIQPNYPDTTSKSIVKAVGCFSGSLERFAGLTKIRHVQNHGLYSPGFLVKIGHFTTLWTLPEIKPHNPEASSKPTFKHVRCFSGSLDRFPGLSKIRHVQNHGL